MKKQKTNILGFWGIMLTVFILFGFGASLTQAQEFRINTRPLTPREIEDYGLDSSLQIANGTPVVGLGQPVYLELFISAGTAVSNASWSIDSVINSDNEPVSSSAALVDSPLTNLPTYNSVERVAYDVLDQAMIVPDVKGTYNIIATAQLDDGMMLTNSIEVVGSVFLGKDYVACTLCHASKQAPFNATQHAVALEASINDSDGHFKESCIKCHSLGYDAAPLAVNGGFDDVAADLGWTFPTNLVDTNWDDMPEALQMKSNVQCENCHGPAQEHMRTGGLISKIGVTMSAGSCGQCHDAPSHHVKNFEWGNSLHGQTEVDRTGSCVNCHTAAGFVDANDPGMNEYGEVVPTTASFKEGITCAACHDPHAAGAQVHQLRDIESVTFENGVVTAEGGAGLVCMSCHKSRRDAESYVYDDFSSHSGPHHGPQGDMIAGVNAIEYGQDLPSSKHLSVVEDSCAQCHMQETPSGLPEYAAGKVGGHSFLLSYNDGTNAPIYLTESCSSCHGEIEDFDFGGEDYNRNGMVEGVQTEIESLLHELGMLLPPEGSTTVSTGDCETLAQKRGAYNYLFVEEDGSLGVHNPKYAAALLQSSIEDLKGGIDVDCDGLVDSWEMAHFDDLTSQSGADDWDNDGLKNIEELNVGTDPKLADTDGDTIWDLAELQGGSDPLDIDSVLTEDLVLLPAAELAYLPKGTGTVVRFQSIDSLTEGSWTNIGPEQISAGSWVFQLENTRTNGMNRFFRATED
ncbi:hypothetical protein P4C99_03300 [Pontiellaceae bacterium B1224]|nr:hypothetical protein [Pontiellaceae bacterium B1224]